MFYVLCMSLYLDVLDFWYFIIFYVLCTVYVLYIDVLDFCYFIIFYVLCTVCVFVSRCIRFLVFYYILCFM